MIALILSYFGYCKVPPAMVKLSFKNQMFLEKLARRETDIKDKEIIKAYAAGQKTMTEFLRSCRIVSQ